MEPRERVAYSAIVDRPPLRLPGGARVAIWPIINVELWETARPMPRQVLPAPSGPSPLPDLPNWAWHEYGMRVGFWRLKRLFDRMAIRATLSINGRVCHDYPRLAKAAHDSDWEFMGHGFVQVPMHSLADQKGEIGRTIEAVQSFCGTPPRGWLGPGLTETQETPDLLAEAGIEYVGDWVLDDEPVRIAAGARGLVALPYTVELNDITMMLVQHHPSDVFLRRTLDQFERLLEEGGERAKVMAIALHPYISGVPHRIGYVEEAFERIAGKDDVVIWTGAQILDWFLAEERKAVEGSGSGRNG